MISISPNPTTGRPESLWLPLDHLPTIEYDFESCVSPSRTVSDSHLWVRLLSEDESAEAYDVCSALAFDVTIESRTVVDGTTARPMRATMSLCAGGLLRDQLADLVPTDTVLLCKYSWMGVTMEHWQCRPVTPELFRIVLLAVARIRHKFPSKLRDTPPDHFQVLTYERGQYIDWHSDKTSSLIHFPNKSIIDGTGVLTIRCRPKGGGRAAMRFQFGAGPKPHTVVHDFELGGGDAFFMGPDSDREWKHRTQPHSESHGACYTIVARWLGLWHPFSVPSDGPAVAAWSPERRAEWAAREGAAEDKAADRARSRREVEDRASVALARTFQPQMWTRSNIGS